MNNRAVIAMSGGVDSSVAAYIMKCRGYDCIGANLRLYDNEAAGLPKESTCCSVSDAEDARSVAFRLDMPFYVFNFSEVFRKTVMDKFVSEYERGATPNPCIDCNRFVKFGKLHERARELDCDWVVTGHYAVAEKSGDRYILKKAPDNVKDQSYVLYAMTQEQLSRTQFPLGTMSKEQVREIALENGFVNAKKRESQDICFVPDGDYGEFLERYTGKKYPHGDFVDVDGKVLGEHRGIVRYTIGQRKGLGLALDKPHYVCKKCMETNTVVLCGNSGLFSREFDVEDVNFIACEKFCGTERFKVKSRYRQAEQWAEVTQTGENRIHVKYDEPQRAITFGQAAVLYDGDTVVAGGTIV